MLLFQLLNLPVIEVVNRSIAVVTGDVEVMSVRDRLQREKLVAAVLSNPDGIAGVASAGEIDLHCKPGLAMGRIAWPRPTVITADASVYSLFEAGVIPDGLPAVAVDAAGTPLGLVRIEELARRLYGQLRRAGEVVQALLKTTGEAVTIVDSKGTVLAWNASAEEQYGIRSEEILGKPIETFFGNAMVNLVLKESRDVRRVYHQPRPGSHILINASPIILDGEMVGAVASDHDITNVVQLSEGLFQATSQVQVLKKEITKLSSSDAFAKIKGHSVRMAKAVSLAKKVASTNATVLIRGESGVGKELFAEAIHSKSGRAHKPFVAINCGAIPPALFESELFGYQGGAFTGADRKGSPGKFELVNGGTLFLDEVGELPLEMQVKLLRVLQDKVFYRVGGTQPINVDVRIIAATNRDLEALIAQGRFRSDLYYRLNVVSIEIPPLRERREDIPELVHLFVREFGTQYGKPVLGVDPEVIATFLDYPWPGNIRELRNVVERMVILTDGTVIRRDDLPPSIRFGEARSARGEADDPVPAANLTDMRAATERQLIRKALAEANGNRAAAARKLGISRGALYYKLKTLGLEGQ